MFDAETYLSANPDVREAVLNGAMPSAWVHYRQFGFAEGRAGVSEAVKRWVAAVKASEGVVPPAHLIERVHGTGEAQTFVEAGKHITLDLLEAMQGYGACLEGGCILDFGAGCGRVATHFSRVVGARQIIGTDIDPESIEWARAEVRRERLRWDVNGVEPPLRYGSAQFDVAYSISVFTHLPEAMQHAWLAELRRVVKPGGWVFLTVANDELIRPHLGGDTLRELDEKGFYYHAYRSTPGLPDFYQAAWHSRDYVQRVWSDYFEIREVRRRGVAGHQDLVIGQRR